MLTTYLTAIVSIHGRQRCSCRIYGFTTELTVSATYNKGIWLIVEYTIHELVLDNLYAPLRTDQSTVVSPCACKVR